MRREHRILDFTQRWSIAPRIHQQTVASHSFYVVTYTNIICRVLNFSERDRRLCTEYAMVHDMFEAWTSDPPGPAKRSIIDPQKMNNYHTQFMEHMGPFYRDPLAGGVMLVGPAQNYVVHDIVKIADIIDSVYYLQMEQWLGNSLAMSLFHREMERLEKALSRLEPGDRGEVYQVFHQGLADLNRETAFIPANDSDVDGAPESS